MADTKKPKVLHSLQEIPADLTLTRYGVSCEHLVLKARDRGAAENYPAFNGVPLEDAQAMLLGPVKDGETREEQLRVYLVDHLNTEALRIYTAVHELDKVKSLVTTARVEATKENISALEAALLLNWKERMENPKSRIGAQTPEAQIARLVKEMGKIKVAAKAILTPELKLADPEKFAAEQHLFGTLIKPLRDRKTQIETEMRELEDSLLGDLLDEL